MENKNLNTEETANSDLGAVSGCFKCVDCGKEFEEYNFTEDCWTCDGDGVVEMEMEWEYEPSMYRCSTCKGKGEVTYLEKKRCKPCKEHYLYDDWEEEEEDEYYCEHCGRACNCH